MQNDYISPCEDCRNNCEIPCWKVEHGLLRPVEWISVEDRLPDGEPLCLVLVSGKPTKNITLIEAYELAEYFPKEGWILEMWPDWKGANVTHWMPLPEPPKEEHHAK